MYKILPINKIQGSHVIHKSKAQNLTRQYVCQAVSEVAERAKATLPQWVGGRIDKAIPIVLADDIELLSDGRAIVSSQSRSAGQYVVNGTCECPDAKRPEIETWCKPKIAVCILKRAEPLARQKRYTVMKAEKGNTTPHCQRPQPQ